MLFGTDENPKEFNSTCGFDKEKELRLKNILKFKDMQKEEVSYGTNNKTWFFQYNKKIRNKKSPSRDVYWDFYVSRETYMCLNI
jgi:hypothetical protein